MTILNKIILTFVAFGLIWCLNASVLSGTYLAKPTFNLSEDDTKEGKNYDIKDAKFLSEKNSELNFTNFFLSPDELKIKIPQKNFAAIPTSPPNC